ncbi:hypothetical protein [Streptosporangium sp. OZ121]|uniref:hypothetical protein n=1 Tax=Streptosporangium sp. OZ121 TaxID=3444183 RepID=UPI003F799275
MSDDFAEIEDAVARLRQDGLDDVLRAHREAAKAPPAPPSIIPAPEFPYSIPHPLSGTARIRCPLDGCPWYHDENPDTEPVRLVLPLDYAAEDVTAALTARANARGDARRLRVEEAITAHFADDHPDR